MARMIYQGVTVDGLGRAMDSATVTVYEADTTTAATIYDAKTGGSVISGAQVTSSSTGYFSFYVDTGDYTVSQLFDITIEKTNYTTQTLSDVAILTSAVLVSAFIQTLLDDADAATARTTLGLAIGTDVQAYHAALASIAGLTTAANKMIYTSASDTYGVADLTAFARTMIANANATDWVSDSGMLALANEYTKNQNLDNSVLSDGTTAVSFETDGNATLTLTQNTTLSSPDGLVSGRAIDLEVIQDGTGGWTLSFHADYDFGSNDSSVNAGANETTLYHFKTNGTNVYCTKWWNPA